MPGRSASARSALASASAWRPRPFNASARLACARGLRGTHLDGSIEQRQGLVRTRRLQVRHPEEVQAVVLIGMAAHDLLVQPDGVLGLAGLVQHQRVPQFESDQRIELGGDARRVTLKDVRRGHGTRLSYASSTLQPVVLRASRSRCACAACASG